MFNQIVLFIADAVVSFFCLLFLLRFIMQARRISFAGPLGGFVVQLTNWAVKPLRRVVPGTFGLDMASLVAALLSQCLLMALVLGLNFHFLTHDPFNLAIYVLGGGLRAVVRMALYILMGALILQAVLSWINPYSPLAGPAHQVTRPFLAPIQRFVPAISGIDLSPLVLILLVQVVLMVV